MLERHVEELHIQVPLSTYAYYIADPYGVLQPDEVNFGLSTNWRDPNKEFLDNMVEQDADEYEGAEAIESLHSSQGLEAHDDFDDGMSID